MGTAAAYSGDIGKGAWQGALGGMAVGGIMWGMNTMRTNNFIKNHVALSHSYTAEQRAAVLQSIREAGQSPVGGRLMSRFIKSNTILRLMPESMAPGGSAIGVTRGTNNMYFDGDPQNSNMSSGGTFGQYAANEPWGPTEDAGTAFTHELGHTISGYNLRDPFNVAYSENLYRGWTGAPARNDYGVLSQGQSSEPVYNRSFWDGSIFTW